MSDHERGAYTPPTEGPLAFEARQPVRGARPFPVTLVVSVLVLLGLAAAIFVFYRSGVRQAAGPPQDVGAPVGGLKAAAPADAQPQDAAAGLEIYRAEGGQPPQMVPTQPQFTAPPEQPQARPQAGPPVIVTPPPAGPVIQSAAPPVSTTPPAQQQPVLRPAQSPPPPAAAARVAPPAAKAAPEKIPEKIAEKPKPAAEKVVEKPAPAKAVAAKPAEKPAVAKPGAAAVQIGAVSSTALADRTWNEAVALAPGLAAGKGKGVEKVDKEGKTLYRTSVTGFASKADAAAFCAKLKASGRACFVK